MTERKQLAIYLRLSLEDKEASSIDLIPNRAPVGHCSQCFM